MRDAGGVTGKAVVEESGGGGSGDGRNGDGEAVTVKR
jgi:hypothetical protein